MPTRIQLISAVWDGIIQTGKTPRHPLHPRKSPMLYLKNAIYQRITDAQNSDEQWGEIGQQGAIERNYTYYQIETVINALRVRYSLLRKELIWKGIQWGRGY